MQPPRLMLFGKHTKQDFTIVDGNVKQNLFFFFNRKLLFAHITLTHVATQAAQAAIVPALFVAPIILFAKANDFT
jgi:hypothetical protein